MGAYGLGTRFADFLACPIRHACRSNHLVAACSPDPTLSNSGPSISHQFAPSASVMTAGVRSKSVANQQELRLATTYSHPFDKGMSPMPEQSIGSRSDTPMVVCHSHLRWDWVFQRPQHLLSRLSKIWPVIIEEEPVFDDRPPGLDVLPIAEDLTRSSAPSSYRTRLRSGWPGGELCCPGAWAAKPDSLVLLTDVRTCTATVSATARSWFTTVWTSWPASPAHRRA